MNKSLSLKRGIYIVLFAISSFPTIGYNWFGKAIFIIFFSNAFILKNPKIFLAMLIAMLLILFSSFFQFSLTKYFFLDILILLNCVGLLLINIKQSHESSLNIIWLIYLGCFIQVIYGLFNGNTAIIAVYGMPVVQLGFGTASLSTLFSILALLTYHSIDKKSTFFFPLLILPMFLLIISAGRAPLLALVILLIIHRPFLNLGLKILFTFIVLVIMIYTNFLDLFLARTFVAEGGDFSTGRLLVWTATLNETGFYKFFGFNLGELGQILENIRPMIGFYEDQLHNELLRMYITYGYAGVILYLFLILRFLISYLKGYSPQFSGTVLLLLIIGLTDNTLVYFHFWTIAYLVYAKFPE